jgi:hypothetical protein
MPEDFANDLAVEEKAYRAWERETKNHILSMSNVQKKQTRWSQLFGSPIYSQEINNMVF